ncbi:hypothetical protein ILUMI_25906 [Ignelater luminosus]|uniref:Uncharacterized protein n=1 Tax=Ignelater luminosus TaxID=2038154 RepID=A0A8K0C9K0_IGNLU|nr:hypothetical protein ILUMI_25906 [Ignelater luminosus]
MLKTSQIVVQKLQCVSAATQGATLILFHIQASADRIIIFGKEANLRFLGVCGTWLVHRTFKVSPLFDQVFVIHGYRNETSFPLLYYLPRTEPLQHTPEFSKTILKRLQIVFPEADQKGYFFHFSQAVYRKFHSLPEVLHQYSNDSEFAHQIRQWNALAFIPPDDVQLVYDILMDEPFFVADGIQTLLAESELIWVSRWNRQRTRRSTPMFDINLWNCYPLVLEDIPKTNNNCGTFHRGFLSLPGPAHPTTYQFLGGLKKEQALTKTRLSRSNIPMKHRLKNLKPLYLSTMTETSLSPSICDR